MGVKRSFENFQEFSLEQPEQLISGSNASFISGSLDQDFLMSQKSSPVHPKVHGIDDKMILFAKPFHTGELQDSSTASYVRASQVAPGCKPTASVVISGSGKFHGPSLKTSKQPLSNYLISFAEPCDEEFQGTESCSSFDQEEHATCSKLTPSVHSLEEEHQESPWREVKQLVLDNRFASSADDDSCCHETSLAIGDLGETRHALVPEGEEANADFNKPHLHDGHGNINRDGSSNVSGDELETSVLISRVKGCSGEFDFGSGDALFSSSFPGYFDFNVRSRLVVPVEDAYFSLLSSSPRKQVPVGLDHQADVPLWVPKADKEDHMGPKGLNDDDLLMGTCIISLPDRLIASDGCMKIAQGRSFCGCFEKGSIRCAQIHVKEAREKLKEAIGAERYEQLGFRKMGEEVANDWTDEEERVIHEVIYSNPASLGRKFWNELSMVFPCRSNKELVNYYFNVFILQRRAVQNRSMLLEIDSDDDEWSGNEDFHVIEEDEDSEIEVDDDDDNNEVDIRAGDEDHMPVASYDLQRQTLNPETLNFKDGGSDLDVHNGIKSNIFEGVDDHKKLSVSSKSQQCSIESGGLVCVGGSDDAQEKHTQEEDYFTRQWLAGESNGSSDSSSCGFLYDSFDAKVWDTSCSTGFSMGIDILPTCSMIDEIFGPFTPKRDQVN